MTSFTTNYPCYKYFCYVFRLISLQTMSFYSSLLFLTLLCPLMASKNNCPTFSCKTSYFDVKFPFYTANTPINCTYPGFQLSCTKQGLTSIILPYSGEFLIRYINYRTQEILIYEPNRCSAKRLLQFNLSYSQFTSPYYVNLTFLNCPTKLVKSNYRVIDCLSDSENTTVATTSLDYATNLRSCEIIGTFAIPISKPGPYNDDIVSFVIKADILLTWDRPNCMQCEAKGDKCGINTQRSYQTMCYSGTGKNKGLRIFKIVSLSVSIPLIACVITFAFIVCSITRTAQQFYEEGFVTHEIEPQTDTPRVIGLDETTIESYTKVTLGESIRLPGPGDGTCAICLSEFCAKDTVRVIPECRHCFHATCIDEWLRMRNSCPVCRNSPMPAHENVYQD